MFLLLTFPLCCLDDFLNGAIEVVRNWLRLMFLDDSFFIFTTTGCRVQRAVVQPSLKILPAPVRQISSVLFAYRKRGKFCANFEFALNAAIRPGAPRQRHRR